MNIQAIRWIDRWLGAPLCFTLTCARRLTELLTRQPDQPVRAIVFIKLVEQGSTVLAQSAIRKATELVGKNQVYFLVFEENRFILDAMSLIPPENVLPIRQNNPLSAAADTVRAIATLRKRGVNAAVDLEFFARFSAALCLLTGAKIRVGFHAAAGEGPYRGDLMTHRLRYNPYLHTSATFRSMVEALRLSPGHLLPFNLVAPPAEDPPSPIELLPAEIEEIKSLLRRACGTSRFQPLILLNPNCSDILPLRRWPTERYVELARRLIQAYPQLHVAMTGAPPEKAAVEALVRQVGSDRCFSLAGCTTLRQLLAAYSVAEVLVTNDSGPAHFAALTPIDVVTLFGPETPRLFAAVTPRNHVFWEGIACSPCVSALNQRASNCRDNVCMQRIDTDRVFETVCRVYEARINNTRLDKACSPPALESTSNVNE